MTASLVGFESRPFFQATIKHRVQESLAARSRMREISPIALAVPGRGL
jgi:hypothetical protein